MKLKFIFTISIVSICFFNSSCILFKNQIKVVGSVPLEAVFANVLEQYHTAHDRVDKLNDSIGKITHSGTKDTLIINETTVIFDNTVSTAGVGSLSILIFKGGYSYTRKKETTVKFDLKTTALPVTLEHFAATNRNRPSDPDALSKLIYNAAVQFTAFKVKDEKLQKSIEIDIAFSVDQYANINVSGPIGDLTPDVNVSRDVQNTHTVMINFLLTKTRASP